MSARQTKTKTKNQRTLIFALRGPEMSLSTRATGQSWLGGGGVKNTTKQLCFLFLFQRIKNRDLMKQKMVVFCASNSCQVHVYSGFGGCTNSQKKNSVCRDSTAVPSAHLVSTAVPILQLQTLDQRCSRPRLHLRSNVAKPAFWDPGQLILA